MEGIVQSLFDITPVHKILIKSTTNQIICSLSDLNKNYKFLIINFFHRFPYLGSNLFDLFER
jgi:hypothetical protein